MKCFIERTCGRYGDDLLETYPCLEKYGYQHIEKDVVHRRYVRDENGKRIETDPVLGRERYSTINIVSMEELLALTVELDEPLIFSKFDRLPTIEIYDGYRE